MAKQYDVIIVGGGVVGTSLALALSQHHFSVALVDSLPPVNRADSTKDNRILALAAGTQVVLERLGVWQYMQEAATAIEHIHVSNRGSFGAARLHAEDFSLSALGYMVAATELQLGLNQAVEKVNLDQYHPATLIDFNEDSTGVAAKVETQSGIVELKGRLLVGADGTHSRIRQQLEIETMNRVYSQHAIVAKIQLEEGHRGVAYERFIDEGAIALLPYMDNQVALIWSAKSHDAKRLMALNESAFLQELQQSFGYRLGIFKRSSPRFSYPLEEVRANKVHKGMVLLLGNSAQTLHPIAAQGFNLALRHVAMLTTELASSGLSNLSDVLSNYDQLQHKDTKNTLFFTNSLVRFFSDEGLGRSKLMRGGLISAFDLCPPVKRYLLKGVMKGVSLLEPST